MQSTSSAQAGCTQLAMQLAQSVNEATNPLSLFLFCTCAGNMKERIKEHSDHIRLHSGLISDTRDQIYSTSRHSPRPRAHQWCTSVAPIEWHSGIIISTQSASGSTQRSLVQALTVRHIFRRCEHIFNHSPECMLNGYTSRESKHKQN